MGGDNIGQIGQVETVGGDENQVAILSTVYNQYGQPISRTDPEENVSVFLYYPETAPFDGTTSNSGGTDTLTGGYLRRVERDVALPHSDSQLNVSGFEVDVRDLETDHGRNSGYSSSAITAPLASLK